jgi:uncharacterized protein YbjT (DUF2867 family)
MTEHSSYRILLTGASGFAGGAVLKLCLDDPRVSAVTSVGRKASELEHPKLTEVVHAEFDAQSAIADHYRDLDAVFFCLGISQSDVREEERYREITYGYTMESARLLREYSPRAVFHFLTGAGTNVNGRFMWARIKGEAERDLSAMGLGGAVHYRPALIVGQASEEPRYAMEKWMRPLEFLYRPFKSFSIRTGEFGCAMIQAMVEGLTDAVLENRDLRVLAERYQEADDS